MLIKRSLLPLSLALAVQCSPLQAEIRIKTIKAPVTVEKVQNDVANGLEQGSETLNDTSNLLEDGSEELTTLKLKVREVRDEVREARDEVREVRDDVRTGKKVLKLTSAAAENASEKLAGKTGVAKSVSNGLKTVAEKTKSASKALGNVTKKLTKGGNILTKGGNVLTQGGNQLSKASHILKEGSQASKKGAEVLSDSAKVVRGQSDNVLKSTAKNGAKSLTKLASNPTKTLKLAKTGGKLARAGSSLGVSLVVEDVVGIDPIDVGRDLVTDPKNIIRSLDPKNVDQHLIKQSKHIDDKYLELGYVKDGLSGIDKVTNGSLSKTANGIDKLTGGDLRKGVSKIVDGNLVTEQGKVFTQLVREKNVDTFLQSQSSLVKNEVLKFGAAKKIVNGVDTISGGVISKTANKLDDVTGGHLGKASKTIGNGYNKVVDGVGDKVVDGYNGVKKGAKTVTNNVEKEAKKVGNNIKNCANKAKKSIDKAGKNVGKFVKGIFGK